MAGNSEKPKISTTSQRPNTNKNAVKQGQSVGKQRSTSSQDNTKVSFMKGSNK